MERHEEEQISALMVREVVLARARTISVDGKAKLGVWVRRGGGSRRQGEEGTWRGVALAREGRVCRVRCVLLIRFYWLRIVEAVSLIIF